MAKTVVYTAIFGGVDDLLDPKYIIAILYVLPIQILNLMYGMYVRLYHTSSNQSVIQDITKQNLIYTFQSMK